MILCSAMIDSYLDWTIHWTLHTADQISLTWTTLAAKDVEISTSFDHEKESSLINSPINKLAVFLISKRILSTTNILDLGQKM